MSATDEFRALLDERGVEWIDRSNGYADVTEYVANGVAWSIITKDYINPGNDWTKIRSERTTPERAIEATLGGDTKGCENLLWELVGALDIADATDASKKPIVTEYARRIAARCRGGR
jgi:hypothetical protein